MRPSAGRLGAAARGHYRIVQQHRPGHRADAAGHWRDRRSLLSNGLEVDIANETPAALLRRIRDARDANVDDDAPSRTMSAVIVRGRPIAAIRMSALARVARRYRA